MKGLLGWFKNNTKIKRWMFIILIGMVLICYGISKILVSNSLVAVDLIEIIATFVGGFIFFIIGLIKIQRRSLEIVIEANTAKEDNEINIKTLLSKKNIYQKGPNIVVIGGGNGIDRMLSRTKKIHKQYYSNCPSI